jgi:hypothetical protein
LKSRTVAFNVGFDGSTIPDFATKALVTGVLVMIGGRFGGGSIAVIVKR